MAAILQYRRIKKDVERDVALLKSLYTGEEVPKTGINWQEAIETLLKEGKESKGSNHSNANLKDFLSGMGIDMEHVGDNKNEQSLRFIVKQSSNTNNLNPKDWTIGQKWRTTAIVGLTGFLVAWASAIDSAVMEQAKQEFGVSDVTESLATASFLAAFGIGALCSGPLSETIGRLQTYLYSLVLFMVFIMASALSPNIGAQIVFRAFSGFFGSTPLTTFGGSTSDLWNPVDRAYVFPVMACLSFLGPFLAPLVGSYIGFTGILSWRWVEWITLIMAGLVTILIALFCPETYVPTLLERRAYYFRVCTGDSRFVAQSTLHTPELNTRLKRNFARPFILLFSQYVAIFWSIYLSIVYAVLFGFLSGYTFIFGDTYKMSQGSVGLMFIGMNVGFLIALGICPWIFKRYKRSNEQAIQAGEKAAPPEQRLWYAMLAAPCFAISLFWMGWTAFSSISFWSPLLASVMFGFSVQGIFISSYLYLIDVFEGLAASALVSLTISRYLMASGMVIIATPMYSNLGVHWTLTLLGCIGFLCMPIPFAFYRYGHLIRARNPPPDMN